MKEVKRKFLKLAKEKHPDGGKGNNEDFVELLNAKETLMKFIQKHIKEDEVTDEEKIVTRKEYKLANMEKLNTDSVTIHIPTIHVSAWVEVLTEELGLPTMLATRSGPQPKQFRTSNGICLTIWHKIKKEKSTMLIQGSTGYF